jgi:hypothetical protein
MLFSIINIVNVVFVITNCEKIVGPVTGECCRIEDHPLATTIASALAADAEKEELAICNIEIIDNLEKSLKISADVQAIPPALAADAEKEELAACNIEIIHNLEKVL